MADSSNADTSAGRALPAAALARLATLLPASSLRVDADALERHAHDETEDLRFPPAAVALPTSVAEVAAILRWANSERVPVTPQGARTGLSGGALPVCGGLALSLERLDRIRDLNVVDMTVETEAGVVTGQLQEAVAQHGLFYPPDPASRESCLIGGNIAEDSAGPHSCKYGTTRRYVLGLEAVLASGDVVRTGSANRKDVTGYNLTQLLVGSEGTLAVITAATLRLLRQPGATLVLGIGFDSLEKAARAVGEIFASGVEPAACELMEARALELVARTLDLPSSLRGAEAFLLLELDGETNGQLLATAARLAEVLAPSDAIVAQDARAQRRLWQIRAKIGEAVKARSPYKEVDAVVPRSALAGLVRAAQRAAAGAGIECVCYGHAGDGNLHVNLLRGDLDRSTWESSRDRAETELIGAVLELGGTISGEHGIGWTQRRHISRALAPGTLDMMLGIKRVFDPRGILNPDKIFP